MNRSIPWRVVLAAVGLVAAGLVVTSFYSSAGEEPSFAALKRHQKSSSNNMDGKQHINSKLEDVAHFWKTVNMEEKSIPAETLQLAKTITVNTATLDMTEGGHVFYQHSAPTASSSTGQFVLLLHGAAFSSQNWRDLGTLGLLAAMGHTVVAVDLPGAQHSKSTGAMGGRDLFLASFLTQLQQQQQFAGVPPPVVISPSMSGGFSIPALVAQAKRPQQEVLMKAFVPVAPVQTQLLTPALADKLQLPTLILRGSRDQSLGTRSVEDLQHLPNSQTVVINDAGHPAYIDQPEAFHKLLYNFLRYVGEKVE